MHVNHNFNSFHHNQEGIFSYPKNIFLFVTSISSHLHYNFAGSVIIIEILYMASVTANFCFCFFFFFGQLSHVHVYYLFIAFYIVMIVLSFSVGLQLHKTVKNFRKFRRTHIRNENPINGDAFKNHEIYSWFFSFFLFY